MNIYPKVIFFLLGFGLMVSSLFGQTKPAPTAQPAPTGSTAQRVQVRQLAPNVFYKVDPFRDSGKVFVRHDIPELLTVDSTFDFAKDVSFHQNIWYLEFEFKPIRMIEVNIPQPNGQMMKKNVWYMIYKVKNPGKAYQAEKDTDNSYKMVETDEPINFAPYFTMECNMKTRVRDTTDPKKATNNYKAETKYYRERFVPLAIDYIRQREDPGRKILSSVEMCRTIKVGEEYWGVATWIDVDKTTNKFSIYIRGLTNAYRWIDDSSKTTSKDIWAARKFERKILKLNFWRPADEYYENEKDIIYGQEGELDYLWIFM